MWSSVDEDNQDGRHLYEVERRAEAARDPTEEVRVEKFNCPAGGFTDVLADHRESMVSKDQWARLTGAQ